MLTLLNPLSLVARRVCLTHRGSCCRGNGHYPPGVHHLLRLLHQGTAPQVHFIPPINVMARGNSKRGGGEGRVLFCVLLLLTVSCSLGENVAPNLKFLAHWSVNYYVVTANPEKYDAWSRLVCSFRPFSVLPRDDMVCNTKKELNAIFISSSARTSPPTTSGCTICRTPTTGLPRSFSTNLRATTSMCVLF